MAEGTRDRILAAAMRLFGEQGFAATSVAQIEAAAGLRPGSGGLYRHFSSKDALLSTGLRERLEARGDLLPRMAPEALSERGSSPEAVLLAVADAGLRRLEDERDVNRILVRDLSSSPELLAFMRDREIRTNHRALVTLLVALGGTGFDAEAVAAILNDAISQYWLLADVFGGEYPLGIPPERYRTALVAMTVSLIGERQ